MAKYKDVTTTGPIEWAKIFENNRDMEGYEGDFVKCEGAYTLNQILTQADLEKLEEAGSQKAPIKKRLINDKQIVVKFVRKHLVTRRDGSLLPQAGGPPKITDADGNPWTEEMGLIGNGSIAEVTNLISTFKGTQDGKMYSRTTLTGLKILEHIKHEEKAEEMGW